MVIDPDFWTRRRVLVTGHTGFKGAWLSLWLQSLGAEVTGLSRGVARGPSFYELAGVGAQMREQALDIRDVEGVRDALARARAEIVFHLAGQPLVGRSLRDPVATFEVNLMGTVNVLDAVRLVGEGVRAVVLVTSDRCYDSAAVSSRPLRESDPLGASDPYAGSKAAAELAAGAYRRSFFTSDGAARIATVRAGNVIGGGDWGEDRLLPDAVRAVESGRPLRVRSPLAVRPWQHVLNPLSGYLRLAEALLGEEQIAGAWNFGPAADDLQTVSWIVERLAGLWDGELQWELEEGSEAPQDAPLALDSAAAQRVLGWRPTWDLADALELLVGWHRAQRRGEDMRRVSLEQLESFAVPHPPIIGGG